MSDILSSPATLAEMQTDLTRKLILDAALHLLEKAAVHEITYRAVAKEAGMSERTIFRYFATREEFLDAMAAQVTRKMDAPHPPRTLEELTAFPRTLYSSFEAKAALVKASLHSELFPRIARAIGQQRTVAARKLLDAAYPRASEQARRVAAHNIRYYLGAYTWRYYRFVMHCSFEETVECAETAVRQAIAALRK
jgi:AcrR family transcriptional regulator